MDLHLWESASAPTGLEDGLRVTRNFEGGKTNVVIRRSRNDKGLGNAREWIHSKHGPSS